MPVLEIDGHGKVEVGKQFLSLSPRDQVKTVEEIISLVGKDRFFNPQPDNPIGPPLAPSKTPPTVTQNEKEKDLPGNVATRLYDAAVRGKDKAVNAKDPIGLNPETIEKLRRSGFFPNKGTSLLNPFPHLNEAVGIPLVKGADAALRSLNIAILGGAALGGQVTRELGASQGDAKRAERELVGLVDAGGFAFPNPVRITAASNARGANPKMGSKTTRSMAAKADKEAVQDMQAFKDLSARPLGISLNKGPVASVGKQLSETPIVGGPLRKNIEESFQDAANASEKIAKDISPLATRESVGANVQRNLKRFKEAGISKIDAQSLKNIGVTTELPVGQKMVMSKGAENLAKKAAPIRAEIGADISHTTKGVVRPTAAPLQRTLTNRTRAEDLTPKEISRIIQAPAHKTSIAAKSEALYKRAEDMIPKFFTNVKKTKKDGSNNSPRVNPSQVAAVNTRVELDLLNNDIKKQISGQNKIKGELADRINNKNSSKFIISDLFAIRSEVGKQIGRSDPLGNDLSSQQLRRLYAALSRDIELGLETLANRAAMRTKSNGTDRVSIETARKAAGALRAFRTADRFYRRGQSRIDSFKSILKAKSPEDASKKLSKAMIDGEQGDIRMARTALQVLRPQERAEFAALWVRDAGAPTNSARGLTSEVKFSPDRFVTSYNKLSPEMRSLLFGKDHEKAVENLFRISRLLAKVEALANKSRSGTNTVNLGGLIGALSSVAYGNFFAPLMIGGSFLGLSIIMSRPSYARWMAKYIQLRSNVRNGRSGSVNALARHVRRMEVMTQANPALLAIWPRIVQESDEEINDFEEVETARFKFPDIMGVSVANADDGVKKEDPLKGTDYLENLVLRQGAGQGLIFGLGDELEALVKAGKTSGPEYDAALKRAREINDAFFKENPLSSIGAQVAGGLLPFSKFQAARAGISAIQDANLVKLGAYGAAHGFGRGEGKQDRLASAGTSAALAAAGGTALPYMFHAPGMAARALKSLGGRAKPSQAQSAAPRTTPSVKPLAPPSNNLPRGNFSGSQPAPGVKPTLPPQGSTPSRFAQRVARARSASESKSLSNVSQARSKIRENIEEMMRLRKVRVGTGKLPNQAPYAFKRQWHPEVKKEVLSTNRDVLKASFSEVKKYYPGITKELFKRKSYETRARIIQGVFWRASKTKIPTQTIVKWLRQAAKNSQ